MKGLVEWWLKRMTRLPPPRTRNVETIRNLACPVGGGVVLLGDLYRARGSSGQATVLVRTPYGRSGFGFVGRAFAERGYQVLVQAVRGTDGSGGVFDPFRQEGPDSAPVLAWIREQSWFTGDLLLYGPSYLGYAEWPMARLHAPEIKAMAAQLSGPDVRRAVQPGGAFALDLFLRWSVGTGQGQMSPLKAIAIERRMSRAVNHLPLREADVVLSGQVAPFWRAILVHADDDTFWRRQDHWDAVARCTIPVHLLGGWYDFFLPDTVRTFQLLRARGRSVRLVIGPWAHGGRDAMRHDLNEALAWFTAHLTGVEDPARSASVTVYVTGVEQWRDFSDWPPVDSQVESWYLQAGHGLSRTRPMAVGADRYHYDPANPTPARGGIGQVRNFGAVNQRRLEARPDVLVYTSTALTEDLTIAGPVTADLFVQSSTSAFDLFVCLCDVSPRGSSVNLSSGIKRVKTEMRGGLWVTVELWPRAHVFRRGHRLRLQVSGGAHPHVARNLGTAAPADLATEMVTSQRVVHFGPERLSRITLTALGSSTDRPSHEKDGPD